MPYDAQYSYNPELEAINDMLAAIGETPVSTLEDDSNTDVMSARRILAKQNRMLQSKGWTFNIDEAAVLTPDANSGLIPYLQSYLKVSTQGYTYTNRGGFLFDRTTRTDRFSGPVTVSLIELIPYDEMPEVFKNLIVAKASKQFNTSFFGAPEVDAELSQDIAELTVAVAEYELDDGAFNIFTTDPFVSGAIGR